MIYIARLRGFAPDLDVVKIGHSRYPANRYGQLRSIISREIGHPIEVEPLRELRDGPCHEQFFHTKFQDQHLYQEYFHFCDEMLTFDPRKYDRTRIGDRWSFRYRLTRKTARRASQADEWRQALDRIVTTRTVREARALAAAALPTSVIPCHRRDKCTWPACYSDCDGRPGTKMATKAL